MDDSLFTGIEGLTCNAELISAIDILPNSRKDYLYLYLMKY